MSTLPGMERPRYTLGATGIEISPIGLGCWQFSGGKGLAGFYWKAIEQDLVNRIVAAAIDGGVNWFDTAEAYGKGRSEAALSTALTAAGQGQEAIVATKWFPMLRFAGSIRSTFPDRLRHLAPYPITLHQVHHPGSFSSIDRQMDEMADLAESGSIRAVGVSNFSAEQMRVAHEGLARRGLPLASNQMRYSLLDRRIETNGVLETARELGVSIIAYSPLEQGILTGKFHESEEARANLRGPRKYLKQFKSEGLERTAPLVEALRRVAEHHDATAAQVALAWVTQRHGESVVAIPGASSIAQARGNAGSMTVRLEVGELDELAVVADRVAR
jgi:aryl-alcohol dehydrogenase-like predicted oxidoreductase